MLPSLKTAFTLLSMLQLIHSRAVNPPQYQQIVKEVIHLIQQLNSGVQVSAATPLSFALLSGLIIDDDGGDDDDVLQCPRPGAGTATTGIGVLLDGRSPSHWLNPLHSTYCLGHPGPFQPRLCVISTCLGGTSSSWGWVRQSFPPDIRYFAEEVLRSKKTFCVRVTEAARGHGHGGLGSVSCQGLPALLPVSTEGFSCAFPSKCCEKTGPVSRSLFGNNLLKEGSQCWQHQGCIHAMACCRGMET